MFRKSKPGNDNPADGDEDEISAPPLKPFSKRGSHAPPKPPSKGAFHPDVPRRSAPEIPGAPRRVERPRPGDAESKRLTVGRDICLSGEITSCDKLVVEGRVEATLTDARAIEVSPTGLFKGTAHVEEADISGRYEGELIAHDRLIVRNGGRISGSVRYGRIIIESGGEVSGDMQTLESAADSSSADDGSEEEDATF